MTLMVGATVRLVAKYDPAALVKAMAEEGITILNGVPATYQRLLEYRRNAGLPKLDRGKLRLISVAGAPLDLDLKSRVEQELGLPLLNGYGITECSPESRACGTIRRGPTMRWAPSCRALKPGSSDATARRLVLARSASCMSAARM